MPGVFVVYDGMGGEPRNQVHRARYRVLRLVAESVYGESVVYRICIIFV